MKPLCVPIIVSLAFLVGCAKNGDVTALKSEVATLKESISLAKNDAQEKTDSLQTKCDELEQEVAKLKASNSELADGVQYQATATKAAESEISKLGVQLAEEKMSVDAMGSLINTKEDELDVLKLEDRVGTCEQQASGVAKRLDEIEEHDEMQDMEIENKFKQVKEIFQARDAEERMADLAWFRP